jgi:teichuronic acid biosynthesis glycosyltransferase TuaC
MIKTLTLTTLFPNSVQPNHGIFVANRLEHLLATGDVATEIVAPVPWFPSTNPSFGQYARQAAVPDREQRFGRPVYHPRYAVIPKVGMTVAPGLLYLGARRTVAEILRSGFDFDLIDAHYFYPDGVAAIMLGKTFRKPVIITARGTDIHRITDFQVPRHMILWAARQAAAVVTVCRALKERLVELGAEADKTHVFRNGVDLDTFRPTRRDETRAELGVSRHAVLLSVGNLIPLKGIHLAIEAVAALPQSVTLMIAGRGPEEQKLKALCDRLGVSDRVRFLGQIPHAELAQLYSAGDILVLASEREGWPNVLLEAMACGTPVVASDVWGTPEIVTTPAAGLLVGERTGAAFASAIARLLAAPPRREATRLYAEQFSWDATTDGQRDLFRSVVEHAAAG